MRFAVFLFACNQVYLLPVLWNNKDKKKRNLVGLCKIGRKIFMLFGLAAF